MSKNKKEVARPPQRVFTQEEAQEMASMIDGANEIIAIHGYNSKDSPYTQVWVKSWLKRAKGFGATTF